MLYNFFLTQSLVIDKGRKTLISARAFFAVYKWSQIFLFMPMVPLKILVIIPRYSDSIGLGGARESTLAAIPAAASLP